MRYVASGPSAQLAGRVRLFWSLEDANGVAGSREPVLPDGCPEIIFNFGQRFQRYENGGSELQPRTLVAGQMRRAILIGPTGSVDLFGVRFQPFGVYGLFGKMTSLTDRIENAENILTGEEGRLYAQLAEADGFSERIAIFESFLAARSDAPEPDAELRFAVEMLERSSMPIRGLAGEFGWSERRLERQFKERIGVSPKTFARVSRFQRMVRRLESGAVSDLAGAALYCGYYDQAHMTREFTSFAGVSPRSFLEASHGLSEFFVAAG